MAHLARMISIASTVVVGGLMAALIILSSFTGTADTVEWPTGSSVER